MNLDEFKSVEENAIDWSEFTFELISLGFRRYRSEPYTYIYKGEYSDLLVTTMIRNKERVKIKHNNEHTYDLTYNEAIEKCLSLLSSS